MAPNSQASTRSSSTHPGRPAKPGAFVFSPRILRSPWADFYGPELEDALKAHPEDYLRQAADEGYNGLWLHAVLRDTVASNLFPGTAQKRARVAALNRFVEKAGAHGFKIYLYLCEPRSLRGTDPFWQRHGDLAGQPYTLSGRDEGLDKCELALCTSTSAVKEFLEQSAFSLFRQAPGLGGAFMITASEFHTHCYSHSPLPRKVFTDPYMEAWSKRPFVCPRCRERPPPEVTAEVIRLINRGIKSANPKADVMAWTWSWYIVEKDPQPTLLGLLPKDVTVISDLERGGWKDIAGKRYPVDEYSYSLVGPSPRFRRQAAIAQKRGMRIMAKMQIGCTHELASIPYLPVPFLLAEKLKRMRGLGVNGYLGCWIFGGALTPMSRVAGIMSRHPQPDPTAAVLDVARATFGATVAPAVCRAWRKLSTAWRHYPFSIPVLYNCPINYATACPLSLTYAKRPLAPNYQPLPRDNDGHLQGGDDLEHWVKPFGAGVVIRAFGRMLQEWQEGVAILDEACVIESGNAALRRERNLARHIALSVHSTINIVRFQLLLRRTRKAGLAGASASVKAQFKAILSEELQTAEEDAVLVTVDPRLGYHAEAHTALFTVADLRHKAAVTRQLLKAIAEMGKAES